VATMPYTEKLARCLDKSVGGDNKRLMQYAVELQRRLDTGDGFDERIKTFSDVKACQDKEKASLTYNRDVKQRLRKRWVNLEKRKLEFLKDLTTLDHQLEEKKANHEFVCRMAVADRTSYLKLNYRYKLLQQLIVELKKYRSVLCEYLGLYTGCIDLLDSCAKMMNVKCPEDVLNRYNTLSIVKKEDGAVFQSRDDELRLYQRRLDELRADHEHRLMQGGYDIFNLRIEYKKLTSRTTELELNFEQQMSDATMAQRDIFRREISIKNLYDTLVNNRPCAKISEDPQLDDPVKQMEYIQDTFTSMKAAMNELKEEEMALHVEKLGLRRRSTLINSQDLASMMKAKNKQVQIQQSRSSVS